jgi:hypothetical protein
MSRSGYQDDCDDHWSLIRWRGAVRSALKGKRGQAFLRELIASLDAMPEKKLVPHVLRDEEGSVCALGAVAQMRAMPVDDVDPQDIETVAAMFGIADAMAREIVWMNDEASWQNETPEARFKRIRDWAERWTAQQVPE